MLPGSLGEGTSYCIEQSERDSQEVAEYRDDVLAQFYTPFFCFQDIESVARGGVVSPGVEDVSSPRTVCSLLGKANSGMPARAVGRC